MQKSLTLPILSNRQIIRSCIRHLRRKLSIRQQNLAAFCIVKHALSINLFDRAKYIALYFSIDGELNTNQLITQLWKQHKQVYLPVLDPFSPTNLIFVHYTPNTILIPNYLGIPEPSINTKHIIPIQELDIMFVPLVAFNQYGQRLGMGRGFYDRILQNWKENKFLPIGLAYDCQRVEILYSAEWDVPLPAILTPSHFWRWVNNFEIDFKISRNIF